MAYSILKKDGKAGNIIHFLADSADDYPFIIDVCDPGSTITIPQKGSKIIYVKAPSGQWVCVEGEGEAFPANDAEVIVPEDDFVVSGTDRPISEFQSDIRVYPTGLTTGTSHQAKNNALYGTGDEANGHFIAFVLPKPEGAQKVKLGLSGEGAAIDIPDDDTYMFRLDEARKNGKHTATVTFSENGGDPAIASFAFNVSKVVFD